MAEPFIGEIRLFGFNFPPRNYAFCNGQTLSISQNTALFALLGTTYGGNGVTTFQLPNLQGRVVISQASGFALGQAAGEQAHTLIMGEMPAHTHTVSCLSTLAGGVSTPVNNYWAKENNGDAPYATTAASPATMNDPSTVGGQPHSNLQPYLVVSFCIALNGVFPSRN
ncbi:MAG TPA: tail fiber protein [Verrucomicrobiae bacterium]|nr:tail fiber protein [Verrucomicrobiae bacterium]